MAAPPFVQAARCYARPVRRRKKDIPSHLDDLPPTMLKKDYASVPIIDSVDDVVRRLLSLEMASQREKMKVKTQQLVEKVRRSPNDNGSFEVQVAILTAKIRTYEEHLQRHPKDKSNRRRMLMDVDRRKKLLAYLRRVRYEAFENTCRQLNIQHSPSPPYSRRVTKRWLVKKAFCIKVQAGGSHGLPGNTALWSRVRFLQLEVADPSVLLAHPLNWGRLVMVLGTPG
ncbi:PREDICTED: 28S ribosomal protein S15, mitochondrial [Chaetura pelagica]|uniref:28S ribosomal protein S15, mitochondrial n=1 Tax=Chaetura pelagica TaxID=8897 RepID=UPI000523D312|nr:PREDICTED: 28S ribosomal protein S15, mitochondrial [Chaetura pelagica]